MKKEEVKTIERKVIINEEKCIGCGMCVKDCVSGIITLVEGKAVVGEHGCIKCGHCEAVCPRNAVEVTGFEDTVEEMEQVRLDPDQLLDAIKTRRTVRQFTDQDVTRKMVEQILEAGRMAPTGGNGQRTSYVVLRKKKAACEKLAVETFQKLIKIGKLAIPFLKNMEIDEHFFFKKAPLVIVIFGTDKVSASLAAENMAFMAEAQGLGVLYSGFFTMCVNTSGKIRKIMGIPKKPKAVTTLVIGYPAVKYHRTVHRNPLNVKWM